MTVFEGAVDATFAAVGVDAVLTPRGGDLLRCGFRQAPDTTVGFGETCTTPRRVTFEMREVANPPPGDTLTVGGETFVIQGNRSGVIRTGSSGASA